MAGAPEPPLHKAGGWSPLISMPEQPGKSSLCKQQEVNTNQFQCKCQANHATENLAALNVKESPSSSCVAGWRSGRGGGVFL